MTDEAPPSRPPAALQRSISTPWRWGAGVLGLATLGAGSTAVFVTEVEAGPVALLLVGAVFSMVAMSGRLPSRLKVGDNEAEWQAIEEYVRETVEDAPKEEKPQEVLRAAHLVDVVPQLRASATAISGAVFEYAARYFLRAAFDGVPGVRLIDSMDAQHLDQGFDAAVETLDGQRRVYFVFKSEVSPSPRLRKLLVQQSQYFQNSLILILARTVTDPSWLGLEAMGVAVIEIEHPDSADRIRHEVTTFLQVEPGGEDAAPH